MNKNGFWIVIAVIVIAVVGGIVFYSAKAPKDNNSTTATNTSTDTTASRTIKTTPGADITLYYGYNCPHCKLVEEYIIDKNIDQKVQFDMKEVYKIRANATDMEAKAKICNIPTTEMGVPFLFDAKTKKCLTGDVTIKEFFDQQANNQ